ncbi:diguanylate cyclase (GGDEF) domain-containing protein [Butyrivibrio sp. Su6]|uniref:EAL domain-containing protein n=1 Tax=Butyrivibrio sp. Su6 TaxID=1520810 RepID=UPI00089ECE56|nr:EAL domain-containing protein [Butyrivibrio sp. Su6]SEF89793.1 diguanylate cyclase (GGDEF) domain-containing protein [Butyrivibrio sp. Su6]
MYKLPDDIKKSYESLKVPMIIIEPLASGDFEPLAISDGFLDFHSLSRDYLKRLHDKWDNEIFFERIHPEEKDKLRAISMDFLEKKTDYDITFRVRMDDGYHLIHSIGYWQTMEDGTDLAFLVYHDVQKHENMFVEIANKYKLFQRDEFYVDALTNLPNINYVNKNGDSKIQEIVARGKNPVVIYLDIDSMQSYNRRYGLKRGDELLILVANILTAEFPHGIVARVFSDHFAVIDAYLSDEETVKKIESVNSKLKSRAFGITTGLNVGIYVDKKNDSLKECIDHSVRANKLVGEDLNKYYRFYTAEDDSLYNHQRYIIENFYTAMDNNWIKVFYQCFLRIETGNGMGFEALARWIDPERGTINPDDFIPALEKYHLMHEMDLYMFEAVCKEIKIRYDEGLPLLPVSINFSRQDFDYIDVIEEINKIYDKYDISQYGIDKSYFIIEITEQGLSKATDKFHEQLKKIRENGYKLWVDDFGSGYSSLDVFSSFDIDLIKFDMSLLINLDAHNSANRVVLRGMIDIAHELGIHTLCEGMETEEQKEFLLSAGCELGQGFFYHKPESLDTILERHHKAIPIPKWESEKERQTLDNIW